MKHVRRLGGSALIAGLIAIALIIGTARLDAATKKGGGDSQAAICAYYWSIITYPYVSQAAICAYYWSIITYPYVSPTIQAYVISLYIAQGCSQ
jgi:hypothetical protein